MAALPAGNDDVDDVPIVVEMRQQHRRGDWPGPVRRPKILRGQQQRPRAVLKPASIEPLQSVIDSGNRCSWEVALHPLILN
jgi:hypothetical protein